MTARGFRTFLSLVLGAVVALAAASAQAQTLRLAHITPPSHGWHKVAQQIDQNLQASDAVDFKLNISPLAQLGGEREVMSLLNSGAVHLSIMTAAYMATREESLYGWFLPYQFDDVGHAGKAIDLPSAREMLSRLDDQGLVGLGYTFAGQRHVLSVNPIEGPADLERKRVRSFPNSIFQDWWTQLGAAPTAMPLGEVIPSLTTNLLDAVDFDLEVVVGLKAYNHAPHLALTNHMAFPAVIVASKRWWESLDATSRQAVQEAVRKAELWGVQYQIEAEQENLQALRSAGATIDNIDLDRFRQVGEKITAQYTERNPLIAEFAKQVSAGLD